MKQQVQIATYQEAAKKLKDVLPEFNIGVIVRLGGTMPYANYEVQINSAQSIKNSIDKLIQKQLLINGGLQTLPVLNKPVYPCVVKGRIRSCGTKVFVANNKKEYEQAAIKLEDDFYIEPLFDATSEYRFHCTRDEVFFEVKKIKRNPEDVLINHKNHFNKREFLKPRRYKEIHKECLKAMVALDLDIACFDVMYNSTDNNNHLFTIAEANTNPELLANTFAAYTEALKKLITQRVEQYQQAPSKVPRAAKEQNQPLIKPVLRKQVLTENQKMQIIRDLMVDRFIVDQDGEYVNFKL